MVSHFDETPNLNFFPGWDIYVVPSKGEKYYYLAEYLRWRVADVNISGCRSNGQPYDDIGCRQSNADYCWHPTGRRECTLVCEVALGFNPCNRKCIPV